MTERPILFSAPMVRALLDGRKTQTRRVVKPQPLSLGTRPLVSFNHGTPEWSFGLDDQDARGLKWWRCPYGAVGDVLWVRESCWIYGRWHADGLTRTGRKRWRFQPIGQRVLFENPGHDRIAHLGRGPGWSYRNSIHMPRWASRITLRVTDIRVERLNDISAADAMAEGMTFPEGIAYGSDPKDAFAGLWRSINGPESWAANPWVWAVSFEVVR